MPYEPHPGQVPIHFPAVDWDRYVCSAGQRSGKTLAAAAEATIMLGIENTRGWIVAPTYDLTDRCFEMVYQFVVIDRIYDKILGINDSVASASNTKQTREIKMKWGSWIRGKSAEAKDSLVGEQLDYIIADESAKFDRQIWERYLNPRLMNREGWCLFISSPGPQNWFWEFYERAGVEPGWASSRFGTRHNPYISNEYLDRSTALVSDAIRRREYEGEFVHLQGLIYPDFRDETYPKGQLYEPDDPRFKVEEFDCHYRAIDVATAHETGIVWAAVKSGAGDFFRPNDIVIYQEYWEQRVSHHDHALECRARTRYPIVSSMISHDAARVNPRLNDETSFKSIQDVYQDVGIYAQQAVIDFASGVEAVSQYLRATLMDSPIHPRIFISRSCKKLRWQFLNYIYKEDADGHTTEKPRKRNDDLMDALRYLVVTRPEFTPWAAEASNRFDPEWRYGYSDTKWARKRRDEGFGSPGIPGMASVDTSWQ